MCETIVLERELCRAYLRQLTNKTMIVSLTGYAFDGNIDNGRDGLNIDLV